MDYTTAEQEMIKATRKLRDRLEKAADRNKGVRLNNQETAWISELIGTNDTVEE